MTVDELFKQFLPCKPNASLIIEIDGKKKRIENFEVVQSEDRNTVTIKISK